MTRFGLWSLKLIGVSMLLGAWQGSHANDLWSIYELAIQGDPIYRAEQFKSESNLLRVPEARSALLPSFTGTLGRDRIKEDLTTKAEFFSEGRATYNRDFLNLSLTQSVFDRQRIIGYAQAKDEATLAGIELEEARQDLLLRIATDYFSVLAARDNLDLAQSNKATIAEQLELAEERLAVGLGTMTDLFDAQARFKLAEADEIRSQVLLEDARQALAQLIGQPPGELRALRPETPLEPPQGDIEAWVLRALAENTGVLVSSQLAEIARKEIDRRRAGHLPVVDFLVDQRFNEADGSLAGPGSDFDRTDIILQLSVPFYRGGRVSTETRQAALLYSATLENLENSKRTAERATRLAYNDVATDVPRVLALEQAVIASDSAVEAKREGFAAGLETNIDVLDAQRDLLRAQRDYLLSRYDYILNVLRLEQAVGALSEDDIQRINGWLK